MSVDCFLSNLQVIYQNLKLGQNQVYTVFDNPSLDAWNISFQSPVNHMIRTMTARPVGDEIWIDGANLKGKPLRWIFSQITSHSFHWSNFVSEDGGQTMCLQEELEAHQIG